MRDRRLVVAVPLGWDAAVLRPLDLRREVAGGRNLYGAGSRFAICRSSSTFDGRIGPSRSGAKWRSWRSAAEWNVDARTPAAPSAPKPRAQLARGLVGERHRHDRVRRERTRRDLLRDAPRDRRRLARPGAGEDADRPAHRLGGAPLLGVQAVERVHRATVPARSAGTLCTSVQRVFQNRFGADAVRLLDHRRDLRDRRRACRRSRRGAPARRGTPRATRDRSSPARRA